jgi:outer membrane protein
MRFFKRKMILIVLIFFQFNLTAQNEVLEQYIQQGLQSNLVLQQRNLSLENAIYALKQARNLYIPTLDFQGLYTTAEGGRSTSLPVGDMLNPVYSTLNQFMGQNAFPMVENQEINFLPKNYYDARIRLSVPVLNMDIIHNKRIQDKKMLIQENEVEIYQRELVKEIKTTYYNYLSALKAVEIHQNAIDLANEGKRTNEKLIEAGKGLHAYVLRSETEIAQASARLTSSELQLKTIQRYFNALLNREANAPIEIADNEQIIPFVEQPNSSAANREELKSLEYMITLREDVVRMNKQVFVPKLNGFADLGSQAEQMRFDDKSMYFMVGLQLNIPIFNGNRNNLKIKEAKNEIEIAKLQKEYVEQQLDVAVTSAHNEVLANKTNYESALKQLEMAETYFRLIDKGYAAGVNTYIETVDARTQLTAAKLAASINYYQFLSALAKLERETASYPIPENKQN